MLAHDCGASSSLSAPAPPQVDTNGIPADVAKKFPHLAGYTCLRLPSPDAVYDVACSALGAVEMARGGAHFLLPLCFESHRRSE